MRILQIIPVFSASFGGPVTVVRSISKELAKRHEVTVYTTSALDKKRDFEDLPVEVEADGYRIAYFPRIFKFSGFNVSPTMQNALKETLKQYDVVHVHSWRHFQDIIVHHYAKKYSIPYILQVHGSLPRIIAKQKLKWIYDVLFGYRFLKDASGVVALSSFEAEQYRRIGVLEGKIAIIPNGIDLAEYVNLPPKGCFKRKFSIPEEKKILLYLGRIHKTKSIDMLIKAYSHLTKKMGVKDTVLVIAGPDDGFLAEVKFLTMSLGISDSVLFTGPLYGRDKLEALVEAEVFVLPSRYETFPMVLLEAYACGKPVIASNVGGLSTLVIEGETGMLFEAGDFKQLAERMLCLLNNESLAEEMGKKARRFVKEKYSIEKVIMKLEGLYNEVSSEQKQIRT